MDLKNNDGYHLALTVQGKVTQIDGKPTAHGTIMGVCSRALAALAQERVRADSNGVTEIVLRIRNKPIATDAESMAAASRAGELDALVEGQVDSTSPREGESYEQYYVRLTSEEDLPHASAMLLAAEWFNRPKDHQATGWLTDPKAVRFRQLNSSSREFEGALPQEYESLKQYCLTVYPDFMAHLTFRTA